MKTHQDLVDKDHAERDSPANCTPESASREKITHLIQAAAIVIDEWKSIASPSHDTFEALDKALSDLGSADRV